MIDAGVIYLLSGMLFGAGVGWYMGLNYGRVEQARDMIETYKHLLDYGRTTKPTASVLEAPPDAETRATVAISDTARNNLTEHLAREANVSMEMAREEAERLLANFETTGALPT